jgi:hypothetical protein
MVTREGAVRPHATGVRFKIRIIILIGKTLCIFLSIRMVNFRPKKPIWIAIFSHRRESDPNRGPNPRNRSHAPNGALGIAHFGYKPPKSRGGVTIEHAH